MVKVWVFVWWQCMVELSSSLSYVNPFSSHRKNVNFLIGKLGGNMRGHHLSLRASEHLSEHLCFFPPSSLTELTTLCLRYGWLNFYFFHTSAHIKIIFGYLIGKTAGRCFATHDLQRVTMKTFRVVPSFSLTELTALCLWSACQCLPFCFSSSQADINVYLSSLPCSFLDL
jgi:hypothetical protein